MRPLAATAVAVLACVLCANGMSAQNRTNTPQASGVIAGTVLQAEDGGVLSDVLVTLVPIRVPALATVSSTGDGASPAQNSQRTGNDGRYRFTNVAPGRYRLVITSEGYEPRIIDVEVSSATGLLLSATLEVEPVAVEPLRQDTTAVVMGRVIDVQTGEPVSNVQVTVEGTQIRAVTDAEGRYWLLPVPPGPQTLRTRRIGYAPNRLPVVVPRTGTVTQDISIATSALLVEGITVTADAVSRAEGELTTATVIEIEAIRHQTATSLADVLEFVPGVELAPPGMDDIQQIALRVAPTSASNFYGGGSTASLASFGTLIVLDGVPVSNNANLQSLGPRDEVYFRSTADGGIDLRHIPAKTIERVEVIRGLPSARWGDLTQGAIIVETRAGDVEPELSIQVDERTTEAAMMGGRSFGGGRHAGTLTLDLSRTRSAPGRTLDEITRFKGQVAYRARLGRTAWGSDKLVLDTRLDAYQLHDDRPEHPNSRGRAENNRDRGFRLSERAFLALSPAVRLTFTGAFTASEQTGTVMAPLTRGPMPFTNATTEGRSVGVFFIGPYVADVTVDGRPYFGFGRLEAELESGWFGFSHRLRPGLEFRREWNSGPGYHYDVLYPPQVSFNGIRGFDRPRSFDDVPALVTSALYLDDQLTRTLGSDLLLTVQAGVRLDMLHDGGHWFTGVQDVALQPRLTMELSPKRWLRFRGSYGHVAKTPSLGHLFPAPQWFDVVNVNWFTNEPEERLAIITTTIEDPANPDLGFSIARKAEAGVEFGFGRSAVTVVAFHDRTTDGVAIRGTPSFLLRDHYDLVDSTRGTGRPPEIVEPAAYSDTVPILIDRPDNIMTTTSKGIEVTAVLPEIPFLKTRLHVVGQWIETRQTTDGLYFGSQYRFQDFALLPSKVRAPYWGGITALGRRALFTYRLVHHQPELGLVFTGIFQHNISDLQEDRGGIDTLAYQGYVTRDARLVPVPEGQRALDEYMDLRQPRTGTLNEPYATPADWMLSVQVSKTLPLNGRLSFWAYNLFDKRGIIGDVGVQSRMYGSMRFGIEVFVPLRGLVGWLY